MHNFNYMMNPMYNCGADIETIICYLLRYQLYTVQWVELVTCPLLSLTWFLTTESPLKMMKNPFYFTLKALPVLKMFIFLPWLFVHIGTLLDQKVKVNFKMFDITDWTVKYNSHIAQYLKKQKKSDNEIRLVIRI